MILESKHTPETAHQAGSFPNFKRLTALLNHQEHPRQMLRTIVLLCKPLPGSSDESLQKMQIRI